MCRATLVQPYRRVFLMTLQISDVALRGIWPKRNGGSKRGMDAVSRLRGCCERLRREAAADPLLVVETVRCHLQSPAYLCVVECGIPTKMKSSGCRVCVCVWQQQAVLGSAGSARQLTAQHCRRRRSGGAFYLINLHGRTRYASVDSSPSPSSGISTWELTGTALD